MSDNPHVLKQPNIGPQQEITPEAAYLAAVTSLPRVLSDIGKVLTSIHSELCDLNNAIDTVVLYCERKGHDEGLFGPEDFSSDKGQDDESESE